MRDWNCPRCMEPLLEAGGGWMCDNYDCSAHRKYFVVVHEPDEGAMPELTEVG
jgi:hypothetical protein